MVYEFKIYCDTCYVFAYLNGFIGNLGLGKIYHEHDTFIVFMMEHGGHDIVILGQSADDLKREDYSEFKSSKTCPLCDDFSHGNTVNGKDWCMKCNAPILPKEKHQEWLENHPKLKS